MLTASLSTMALGPSESVIAADPVLSRALAKNIIYTRDEPVSRSTPRDALSTTARKFPYSLPPEPKKTERPAPKPKPKATKPRKKIAPRAAPKKVVTKPKRRILATPSVVKSIFDFSRCPDSSGIESGITYNTKMFYRAVCNAFPAAGPFGGYRNDPDSYHGQGRAIDVMVNSRSIGDAVSEWTLINRKRLKVMEIIWRQRIWTTARPYWHMMADRGSITANHYDHVHVSIM